MNYEIKYLPSAKRDLNNIIYYISDHLKATKAAMDLLDALEAAILGLKQFPYSYRVYQPIKSLEDEYRLLPVKNYAVYGYRVPLNFIATLEPDSPD